MRSILTWSGLRASWLPALLTEKAAVHTNNLHNSMLHQWDVPECLLDPGSSSLCGFNQWPLLIYSNVRQKKKPPPLTQRQISADINSVQPHNELGDSCRPQSSSLTNWSRELTSLQFSEASQPPSSHRLRSSLSETFLDKPQLTSGLFGFDLCWLYFEAVLIFPVTAAINEPQLIATKLISAHWSQSSNFYNSRVIYVRCIGYSWHLVISSYFLHSQLSAASLCWPKMGASAWCLCLWECSFRFFRSSASKNLSPSTHPLHMCSELQKHLSR